MDKTSLNSWISEGKSTHEIAKVSGKSQTTVMYWLKRFGLKTKPRRNYGEKCLYCGKSNKTRSRYCAGCLTKIRRYKMKLKAVLYKGGKCCRCGWDKHIFGFEFHHRNPDEKAFNLSSCANKAWRTLKPELDKCDLLCSCCHRLEHAKNDESFIDLLDVKTERRLFG